MSTTHRTAGVSGESEDVPTIWILVLALSIGGAERTIVELVNGIDHDQYDVKIWTVFETNPLAEELDEDVSIESLGVAATHGSERYEITGASNPVMYLLAPLSFAVSVRRKRPDVLHSFLFYDNITSRIAGLASPDTTVITGERGFHNSLGTASKLVDTITLPLSDVVVSNSRAGAEYYADNGVGRENLRVIPNGRDLSRYRDASASDVRDEFDIPPRVPLVGTVGRLVERKGHLDLLRAFARLENGSGPEPHLLIVGHGPKREAFGGAAAQLGIDDRVHFTGARDDVPALLNSMDLFAFPSHWEGLPGALLEAMAAGLPIVATRVNGNVELLSDGETGLLVPPRQPGELSTALERLLTDPDRAEELGRQAQSEAFHRYTRDRMVDAFQTLYDECTPPTTGEREVTA